MDNSKIPKLLIKESSLKFDFNSFLKHSTDSALLMSGGGTLRRYGHLHLHRIVAEVAALDMVSTLH